MAQKNNLKYIILGLLSEQPLTGYDIAKAFDSDIGEFWSANHSQIYPLLKKLETEKLITHQVIVTGEKLEKKRYSLTDAGQQEFELWLSSPTPTLSNNKDEFILKLYFISNYQNAQLPAMLGEHRVLIEEAIARAVETVHAPTLALHQNKLTHLHEQMRTKFPTSVEKSAQFGHFLILQHAIEREQLYSNWLQKILTGIEE